MGETKYNFEEDSKTTANVNTKFDGFENNLMCGYAWECLFSAKDSNKIEKVCIWKYNMCF